MTTADALPRLMLVTDRRRVRDGDLVSAVAAAVDGGVGMIQVREPDLDDATLVDLVRSLRAALEGTPIVVNRCAAVAARTGAGLHLPAACTLTPPGSTPRPFGRSAHDEREARLAVDEGADYLVLGTLFPTGSKPGHPGAGAALVRRVAPAVSPIPVFGIGGMVPERVHEVLEAGAHGVAVCSGILAAADPRQAARNLAQALSVTARPD